MLKFKYHDGGRKASGIKPVNPIGDCVVSALSIASAKVLGRKITGHWYKKWWHKFADLSKTVCTIEHVHPSKEDYKRCISPDWGNHTEIMFSAYGLVAKPVPRDSLAFTEHDMSGTVIVGIQEHVLTVHNNTIYDINNWAKGRLPIQKLWHPRKEHFQL